MATIAMLLALALGPASGPEPLALDWRGPEACIERDAALDELRALVPTLADEVPRPQGSERLAVEVELGTTAEGRYWAELAFTSDAGVEHRSLEGLDCELVAAGAVLVIAVTIDPILVARSLPTRAPSEPTVLPPSESAEPSSESTAPIEPPTEIASSTLVAIPRGSPEAKPRRSPLSASIAAFGGGGYGPLRTGAADISLEVGLLGEHWRWDVRGTWTPPRILSSPASGTIRTEAWLVHTRACGVPTFETAGQVELLGCVGIETGVIVGAGIRDTPNPRAATRPWAAIPLGVGLRVALTSKLAFALELELIASLLRGGFTLGDELVQELAPLGGRGLVGLEVRLP